MVDMFSTFHQPSLSTLIPPLKGPESKGYDVLLARMKRSKRISEEVCSVLKERSSMEEEYGKKLAKMAKNFTPLKEDKGYLFIAP